MTDPRPNSALVVVDASALFTIIDAAGPRGEEIVAAIGSRALIVPSIAEYEVTNVIRRYQAADTFTADRADRLYRRFRAIPLRLIHFGALASRMWELRGHVRTSDAAYVAAAEALQTELLTTDRRLAGAAGVRCRILVFDRHEPAP